jgi:hypothetical protein
MNQYLRERDHMEKLIADEYADLSKRIEAITVLLQHPLDKGLRVDLRSMFLLWSDELSQVQP